MYVLSKTMSGNTSKPFTQTTKKITEITYGSSSQDKIQTGEKVLQFIQSWNKLKKSFKTNNNSCKLTSFKPTLRDLFSTIGGSLILDHSCCW